MTQDIILNPAQQEIFDYFCPKFGRSPAGYHLLSAEAGVGKTTLVREIFASLPRGKCYILCPTHKALSLYEQENRNIQTIHRFFKSNLSYTDDGQKMFNFKVPFTFAKKDNKVSLFTIIVDESSMVSSEMLKIFAQIKDVTTILFTCDEAQLPPIDEIISPIFKIKDITKFTLTTNMRAQESDSLDQVRHFRKNVFAKVKTPTFQKSFVRPEEFIFEEFKKNLGENVVIAWTNLKKDYWNTKIRAFLFTQNGGPLDKIYLNEVLTFSGNRMTESGIIYHSSDPVVVTSLEKEIMKVPYFPNGCDCPPDDSPNKSLAIQTCDQCGIDGRKVLDLSIEFYIIQDQYGTEWNFPANDADVRNIKRIFAHHKKHVLKMKTQVKNINDYWVKFYKTVAKYNPDLSYSYAITCHKSQGSEWPQAFIDYANLSQAREPKGIKERLLYTAASRMKENLYFVPASHS